MTQEEKFEEAKRLYETANTDQRYVLESLFPELAESEDERIRAKLIEFFTGYTTDERWWGSITEKDILAWLESQGEHKPLGFNIGDEITVNGQICKVVAVEQKPAEWNEEDEKTFSLVLKNLYMLLDNAKGCSPDWVFYLTNAIQFIKSLKDRVQPQPKSDWCEEDMEMIGNIRRIIEKYAFSQSAVDVNGDLCEKEYIDADNWLKSLKPQNKTYYWTENEIKFAISDYIRGAESYEKMVEKLRCLKPQTQWKPSDDIIMYLERAIEEESRPKPFQMALNNLLKQLKKLREE